MWNREGTYLLCGVCRNKSAHVLLWYIDQKFVGPGTVISGKCAELQNAFGE